MKSFKIINTEIIDSTVADHNGNIQPSAISVLVNIEIEGKSYYLDYQTTETFDYGAYSSILSPYDFTEDYDSVCKIVGEDDIEEFFAAVKAESKAQKKRKEYVDENYNVNDEYYGGMDANSEINKAVKK